MKNEEIKRKTISGFFWQFARKVLGQFLGFLVTLVLARKLMPEEFGIVALCSMFITFIDLFVNSGISIALIQKKEVDELDYNTIFFSGLVLSLLAYVIIFFCAPFAAIWFHSPQVTPVLRISSIAMLIGSFSMVQSAHVSRKLEFKKYFFSSLSGQTLSGIVGVTMACTGFGVWALVTQSLIKRLTSTTVLYFIVRWHPHWDFSFERFKGMYSFAWRQMVANATATISEQLRGYVIGIKYSPADLAFYNRGEGLPGVVYNNVNGTINSVMFPALARLQDDKARIRHGLSRSMKTSSYVIFPALFGLAAVSDKIIVILYTAKWLPAVPFMQLICIIYCFSLIGGANTQAITAMGRSDIVMKWELIKRPIMLSILAITAFISPLTIAIGQCFYSIGVCFFNAYPNKKIIGYPIRDQVLDVGGNFLLAISMALFVYLIGMLPINIYFCLILQIFLGITFYISGSIIFKNDSMFYMKELLQKKICYGKHSED